MRKPREAPKLHAIFQKIGQDADGNPRDLTKLLGKAQEVKLEKYLHWDELWHREPPNDLSREEWWFLLKFQRLALRQNLPLFDKAGDTMNFVMSPIILQNLHE